MTCTKRAALAAVLAATIATSARADTLTRTIQYHANAQPTIYCAAALLCEIRLADGEKITRAWNPQAQIWSPDGGEVNGRPIVTLKPEAPGFHANFVILTTRREYHIMLVSYDGTKQPMRPLYTQFAYDDESRQNARHRAREIAMAPKPVVTPPPLTNRNGHGRLRPQRWQRRRCDRELRRTRRGQTQRGRRDKDRLMRVGDGRHRLRRRVHDPKQTRPGD